MSKKSSFEFPGYSVKATVSKVLWKDLSKELINFSGNQSSVLKNK